MGKDQYEIWLAALAEKRAPALAAAKALITDGKYDEAERTVKQVDDSIYGAIAIAKAYEERLAELVSKGEAKTMRTLDAFRRAVYWKTSAYPEPHTEIEADNYSAGGAEDRARLVKILGYDPDA